MVPSHRLAPSPVSEGAYVTCPAGTLKGVSSEGVERFLGIPYAQPPVGERRFRPAERAGPWAGVLRADRFGPASAQVFDPHEGAREDFGDPRSDSAWVGDEDSLTLNIWRPAGAVEPLPVIVWIHGGANWLESSRLPIYDGTALARTGAIVVSFNYRLGLFGFLDLSPIGGLEGAHSHGLTDQLAAIGWVADNITAFGGDPDAITLMGESAGSMDIGWLVASGRLPRGVRRLVLMSGVASVVGLGRDGERSAHAPAEGRARAVAFLDALGYRDFAALQAAPTGEILERHAAVAQGGSILFDMDTLFYPRTGALAPADPFEAAQAGAASGMDVAVGFTNYELGLWLLWDEALDRRPPEWAAERAPFLPAAARAALPDLYRGWFPDEREEALGMHLLGDAMFAMPSLWMADLLARGGARVFAYRFDWEADPRRRALHAADQAFLFGTHATRSGEALVGAAHDGRDQRSRDRIGDAMRAALAAFVATGDPSTAQRAWPRWDEARALMLFDEEITVARDPMRARREWWTANILPRPLGGGR